MECITCGVTICAKNKHPKHNTKCRACAYKNKYVCYKYSDLVLETLSKKRNRAISITLGNRKVQGTQVKRKGVCYKCGVIICDKNKTFQNSPTQCKHCSTNVKSCKVIYPPDISKQITIQARKENKKNRLAKLPDGQIIEYLKHTGFKLEEISSKMIEIKRKQIIIERKLKNQMYE